MDWISLIGTILGPALIKCLQGTSTEHPGDYVRAHYVPADEAAGTPEQFTGGIVEDALPATMRAIRKAHRQAPPRERKTMPKFSREEVIEITKNKLREAMTASPAKMKAAIAAAKALPDDSE